MGRENKRYQAYMDGPVGWCMSEASLLGLQTHRNQYKHLIIRSHNGRQAQFVLTIQTGALRALRPSEAESPERYWVVGVSDRLWKESLPMSAI
jgi:hypothetical protein